MNLTEFYKTIDEDYLDVYRRLGSGERILKYLRRFADDESLDYASDFLKEKDYQELFRLYYAARGTSFDLGISKLGKECDEMCQLLEDENIEEYSSKIAQIDAEYSKISELIHNIM